LERDKRIGGAVDNEERQWLWRLAGFGAISRQIGNDRCNCGESFAGTPAGEPQCQHPACRGPRDEDFSPVGRTVGNQPIHKRADEGDVTLRRLFGIAPMTVDCVGIDERHAARPDRLLKPEIAPHARARTAAPVQNDDERAAAEFQPLAFHQKGGPAYASRFDRHHARGRLGRRDLRCGRAATQGKQQTTDAAFRYALPARRNRHVGISRFSHIVGAFRARSNSRFGKVARAWRELIWHARFALHNRLV
jgi:hypothetical protein